MTRGLLAALVMLAAAATNGSAQTDSAGAGPQFAPPPIVQTIPIRRGNDVRVLIADSEDDAALSQRPVAPLTPEQSDRLHQAREQWQNGLDAKARQTLQALLQEVPHHPEVLTELARAQLSARDYAGLERMAKAERQSASDSLLLGRELALALERLGKQKESAQVALEVWIVSPAMSAWATETVKRMGLADPRGVRDVMRRAVQRYPQRLDFALALGQLEWRLGETQQALQTLTTAEAGAQPGALRWGFAEEMLRRGTDRDSMGAADVFLDIAADSHLRPESRGMAARRGWDLYRARQSERTGAPLVRKALADLPPTQWPPDLLSGVLHGLRQAGMTADARALLDARSTSGGLPAELALEKSLFDLRDGPPERALPGLAAEMNRSPEAMFRYAEALFFAGMPDSSLKVYQRVSEDPNSPFAGAALERMFVIEDGRPKEGLLAFGRIAYEDWRGDSKRALVLTDSLYHALPQGPLWAQTAMLLSTHRESAGDARGALEPLLAVADSLPQDRLAPLARQRAGQIYLERLKDENQAVAQYEECLARYPRAWNAPEVRRRLEKLRRDRRF